MKYCFRKDQKRYLVNKKNLQMVLGMLKYRKDIKGEKENGGMIICLMSRKLTDLCYIIWKALFNRERRNLHEIDWQ